MQGAQCLNNDVTQSHRTPSVLPEDEESVSDLGSIPLVLRIHECVRETLDCLPAFSPGNDPLVISAQRRQAQEQVRLATLEDPAIRPGQRAGTGKTVGNNGTNTFSHAPRHIPDNLPPPLL